MRDDKEHLLNILDMISKIEVNFHLEQFNRDVVYRFGIAKMLECIGEEVKNLSNDFRTTNSVIDWRSIIGMRNFLVHEYNEINWDVVLEVVDGKLPQLRQFIEKFLNDQKN